MLFAGEVIAGHEFCTAFPASSTAWGVADIDGWGWGGASGSNQEVSEVAGHLHLGGGGGGARDGLLESLGGVYIGWGKESLMIWLGKGGRQ